MSELSELESKIGALEAIVYCIQSYQNDPDDLSTYNGGFIVENEIGRAHV